MKHYFRVPGNIFPIVYLRQQIHFIGRNEILNRHSEKFKKKKRNSNEFREEIFFGRRTTEIVYLWNSEPVKKLYH